MAENEASSFDEGSEYSSPAEAPGSEYSSPAEAPGLQPQEGAKMYYYGIAAAALLSLFLVLIAYVAVNTFAASAGAQDRNGDSTTSPLFVYGTNPPKTKHRHETTTTTTTTTTTRPPSIGYGYTVCTIGRSSLSVTMFPVKEQLCDFIIFTHVYPSRGALVSASGNVSFEAFLEVSADQARDRRTLFGLSHSPHALSSDLAQSGGGDEAAKEFLSTAEQLYGDAGLSAIGVMGLVRKVMDFTHEPKLVAWFQALSVFASRITNGTVFLGLKLKDKGKDLASKDKLAKDVFETVKKMKVNLLVLVTHNVKDMDQSSCISEPVSSWSSKAYKNNERLALEQIFKFLVAGLRKRTKIEVALSSTLVLVSFQMKKPVSKPVKFGQPCVRNYRMSMERYCVDALPNVRIDPDSLSAVGFHGNTLFSFETPKSIEKKMRRFVMPLDDVVFHRVGWAFFDLAFEIFNEGSCPSNGSVKMNKFARVAVAKPILTENRERTFNK